jgi:U3 small nucleolar RNA-associated protein 20
VEAFAVASSKLTAKLTELRAKRKRKIAQQVITEPEAAAKRRIKKQQAKRVAKKKKINSIKGKTRKNHRVDQESDYNF